MQIVDRRGGERGYGMLEFHRVRVGVLCIGGGRWEDGGLGG